MTINGGELIRFKLRASGDLNSTLSTVKKNTYAIVLYYELSRTHSADCKVCFLVSRQIFVAPFFTSDLELFIDIVG